MDLPRQIFKADLFVLRFISRWVQLKWETMETIESVRYINQEDKELEAVLSHSEREP